WKAAMHAVVAEQMGVGLDRAEVVDADHLDIVAAGFRDGTQHVAADAAKSIDSYPDSHVRSLKVSTRHVLALRKDVNGRDKPGHDVRKAAGVGGCYHLLP